MLTLGELEWRVNENSSYYCNYSVSLIFSPKKLKWNPKANTKYAHRKVYKQMFTAALLLIVF